MELRDEQIDAIFEAMPDGTSGFLKTWGYRQFARAIEAEVCREVEHEPARAREWLEPHLVNLFAGLRKHQVEEAIQLLLDYIDAKGASHEHV